LPTVAPDLLSPLSRLVQFDEMLPDFDQYEVAHIDRNLRSFARKAGHDGSRIEFSVGDEDWRLPVTTPSVAAITMIHAVVKKPFVLTPNQSTFIALYVVTKLKSLERSSKVLPNEQVEIIAFEPAAP